MLIRSLLALSLLLAGGIAPLAQAEVLIMPNGQPQAARLADQPHRGMTMGQVLKRFGQPSQRIAPVDNPPITRWVYPHYTVYFEDRYVIHTVVHPGAKLAP